MFNKYYKILQILILLLNQNGESLAAVKLVGINCKALDRKFCTFNKCMLKAINRNVTEVTVMVALLQTPVDNVSVSFGIKKRGFDYNNTIYIYSIDGCDFMRNRRRNKIANFFYDLLGFLQYSNMNHTCPYNHDVVVDKYRLDEASLRYLPLRAGHYTIFALWSVNGKTRIETGLNIELLDK